MRKLAYMRISFFPCLSFSARSRFIPFLQQRITPAIVDSSSVPINHGIAATLGYVNRELTNTVGRREDPTGGRRNTQCVTTAAVPVSDFSQFLPRWAGRGFWDKMQA